MTKEELRKEFEKYLKDSSDYYDPREPLTERKLLQMWLDCAEPREKRIAELEKENEMFKKAIEIIAQQRDERDADISILENRIEELEAQIEGMKRCEICNEYTSGSCNYHSCSQQVCKENGMKLFKLKEIKEK